MIPNEERPVVMEVGRLPAYAAPPLYSYGGPQPGSYAEEEPEETKIPLSQYLWILKRHRFRIAGFVTATLLATWIVWGSTYLAIRIADQTMPPFLSAAS